MTTQTLEDERDVCGWCPFPDLNTCQMLNLCLRLQHSGVGGISDLGSRDGKASSSEFLRAWPAWERFVLGVDSITGRGEHEPSPGRSHV